MKTVPAFIDLHVHLREPGQTAKGDVRHETAAAHAGGFGTIVAMANTLPVIDRPSRWLEMAELIRREAHPAVKVIQCAAMTVDRQGREPVDAAALKAAGVIALTDDGTTPQDDAVMDEVAARAAEAGLLLIDHCEDMVNSREGEIKFAARDIRLAQKYGVRMHLQHLSCAEVVDMLRQAQKDGIPVTGEVTPHHLALTSAALEKWGTNAKMAPPLRDEADRLALTGALLDGTITAIATDHAPHTADEKARPFNEAPNGIIGLEAAFPVCHTILVKSGIMPLEKLLWLLSEGPRQILGIAPDNAQIQIDTESCCVIDTAQFKSKSLNCPWHGFEAVGKVIS